MEYSPSAYTSDNGRLSVNPRIKVAETSKKNANMTSVNNLDFSFLFPSLLNIFPLFYLLSLFSNFQSKITANIFIYFYNFILSIVYIIMEKI